MKNKSVIGVLSRLVLFLVICEACSSKKPIHPAEQAVQPTTQSVQLATIDSTRQLGLAELRRIHDAMDGLRIVVEAGVSLNEFSPRLTDALLKIGDLEISKQQTLPKFPAGDRSSVAEIFGHYQNAIDAYKESKGFFGGSGTGLGESDYSALNQKFPLMPSVQSESDSVMSNHRYYPAPSILNALWQYAVGESRIAAECIAKLDSR